jgi:peptide/nickel transport system substrate-binding protein
MGRQGTRAVTAVVVAALLGAIAAGCGGGESSGQGGDGTPATGQRGGKLVVLSVGDVDYIDPGQTYATQGFLVSAATQRAPLAFKPDDPIHMVPDLAEDIPTVSRDGKTVTVKLRSGVRFSPPVDREVTAKDVKYAIERGFFNTVNNGYAGAYFGDLIGAKTGVKPGTRIKGIRTPDAHTVVLELRRPTGGVVLGALSLPLAAPVPESYAARFDADARTAYGQHQVATGPYMVANDETGAAVGYEAGKRISLVRNPGWDRASDFKPAYLDAIEIQEGNDDATVAARRILDGSHLVNGADLNPSSSALREVVKQRKEQIEIIPAGGWHAVTLNTAIPPFDDINVRRAVLAGFDRNALRLTRGGALLADMPTHFLPPNIPGFEEAGGLEGPGFDFLNATGEPNPGLAAVYFRKAGYKSGRFEGKQELLMVGVATGVSRAAAEVAKENLDRMGFDVQLRLVSPDAMLTKFCRVPEAEVAVCPNSSWYKDFADAQTLLDPTFNGDNILPTGNSNASQLDVPAINAAMREAQTVIDARARAAAWAKIDRLVTEQAPAVPWSWDRTPLIRSKDVVGTATLMNNGWDYTFTSVR